MDEVTSLLRYLLTTKYSIDRLDSIVNQLKIPKDRLLQLINEQPYSEYFQLLRPLLHHNQMTDKIALTLDVCIETTISYKENFGISSFSVVRIMLNNVKNNSVRFYICVLITYGQCMQNVQIKLVRTIMISSKVFTTREFWMHEVYLQCRQRFYMN